MISERRKFTVFKTSYKLICGLLLLSMIVFFTINSYAEQNKPGKKALELMQQFEDVISSVAENTGNCVVGISTEKNRQVSAYFRNYGDEIFNEFFRNFFFGNASQQEYKQIGLGSGIIISSEGHILTNEHIISGADKIKVTLADGREFEAKVKGADYRFDIALLKINAPDLPYADLGNSDTLKIGEWAIAIGNPFSLAVSNPQPSITLGVISALGRSLPKTNSKGRTYLDLIQTDAAINPGNSGGPLVNIHGEVIGINVAILSGSPVSNGISFAVPINDAKAIVEHLLWGENILYNWIGISIQDINYVLANNFDLKKAQGALVLKVVKGSLAEASGLRPKDIILKVNSEKVENTLDFINKISRVKDSEIVKLKIIRNTLPRIVRMKLSKMPEKLLKGKKYLKTKKHKLKTFRPAKAKKENKKALTKTPLKTWRGMKVAEITKEFADNFEIETDIGVIVTKVIPDTPAARAGIRAKDIITQINTFNIQTLEDYLFSTSKASGKVLIKTNRAYLMIYE